MKIMSLCLIQKYQKVWKKNVQKIGPSSFYFKPRQDDETMQICT